MTLASKIKKKIDSDTNNCDDNGAGSNVSRVGFQVRCIQQYSDTSANE